MSSVLVDAIVDDFHIDMDREDVRRVQQLITVKKDPGPAEHKKWMFEIVNNWRNGLDVDKFDYLLRDRCVGVFMGVIERDGCVGHSMGCWHSMGCASYCTVCCTVICALYCT